MFNQIVSGESTKRTRTRCVKGLPNPEANESTKKACKERRKSMKGGKCRKINKELNQINGKQDEGTPGD